MAHRRHVLLFPRYSLGCAVSRESRMSTTSLNGFDSHFHEASTSLSSSSSLDSCSRLEFKLPRIVQNTVSDFLAWGLSECRELRLRATGRQGRRCWMAGVFSCCRPRVLTRRFLVQQHSRFQQRWGSPNQFRAARFIVKNLPAVRPIFRALYQTVTDRVQAYIFPFARLAFGRAKFVVVVTFLPTPRAFCAGKFGEAAA